MTGLFKDPTYGHIFVVDNSFIEQATKCPYAAYIRTTHRKRKVGDNSALRFGGHLHATLAYRYRSQALGSAWSEAVQHRILERRFERTPLDSQDNWRTVGQAKQVITAYNKHWDDDDKLEIARVKNGAFAGMPLVEKPFSVKAGQLHIDGIGNVTVFYVGRIDMVIKHAADSYMVVDHKTSSIAGQMVVAAYGVSEQQRGYAWALSTLGYNVVGYTINLMVTRAPTKTGCAIDFSRHSTFLITPPGQLDEWRNNMLAQVATYLKTLASGYVHQNHANCVGRYGYCDFFQVCGMHRRDHADILSNPLFYQDDNWTPLYGRPASTQPGIVTV